MTSQKTTSKSRKQLSFRRRTITRILAWLLLASILFYCLHRYFEYRDQQLDNLMEQLS